jgi:hypothetical protein
MKKIYALSFFILIHIGTVRAQDVNSFIKTETDTLCSKHFYGRGYVNNGNNSAADYIYSRLNQLGLQCQFQPYNFPVNTFPGKVNVSINGKELKPGYDYLLDAADNSFHQTNMQVKKVNLAIVKNSRQLEDLRESFSSTDTAYVLLNTDSLYKQLKINPPQLGQLLPAGCFIIPVHGKLNHDVNTWQNAASILYVEDTVLPAQLNSSSVTIQAKYIPSYKNNNIIAYLPGSITDSYIVITAHYDHLGMMGEETLFPGASDNASGTAMLVYLASYFSKHPQKYAILFIAFSGEEAGLLGSEYYVKHPVYPLQQMRFLLNLDIMGDATDGITVVNATEYKNEFALLNKINVEQIKLPAIKSRGKAHNSDHYYFTEAGVNAFFIYTNGGAGYYHDIFDTAANLKWKNIDGLSKLLILFLSALNNNY